ncbi:5515_t:CDS:2 [Ambispora leptoticha]|uniref:5515_t:CDS:1 n=1 Tax=Ambispora leptoticha TaxID=144679 RepID=A0A9N9C2C7_9GLOM|nr:5515_t:CDS:2 [Ambispora leptoticha]
MWKLRRIYPFLNHITGTNAVNKLADIIHIISSNHEIRFESTSSNRKDYKLQFMRKVAADTLLVERSDWIMKSFWECIEKIAYEKAEIIKNGVLTVIGLQKGLDTPLKVNYDESSSISTIRFKIPLGEYRSRSLLMRKTSKIAYITSNKVPTAKELRNSLTFVTDLLYLLKKRDSILPISFLQVEEIFWLDQLKRSHLFLWQAILIFDIQV